MAQWSEHSPPTNVAGIQIPVSSPFVWTMTGWLEVRATSRNPWVTAHDSYKGFQFLLAFEPVSNDLYVNCIFCSHP